MYAKSNIEKLLQRSGQDQERQPIMTPVERPGNQLQDTARNNGRDDGHPTQYDAIHVDRMPLSHLRNEDGGYLGPAALEHVNPEFPDDPHNANIRPTHFNNNASVSNNPPYDAEGKRGPGSVDVESSSYRSERNKGGACASLVWQERTGCEQMLLMVAAILLIVIVTLATGIGVLKGYGLYTAIPTCQSRECVRAAGEILESLDESVEPCEDFVQFACGGWYATHPVPESSHRWSMLDVINENTLYELKHLLEETPKGEEPVQITAARKVYQACSNNSKWSEVGLSPLFALLDEVGGLPMIEPEWDPEGFQLEDVLSWIRRAGGQTLIALFVSPDMLNNSHYALYVDQGILPVAITSLVNATEEMKNLQTSYMVRTAKNMLAAKGLGGNETLSNQVEIDVDNVWNFTVELAQISIANTKPVSPWITYNPMTVDSLNNITNHEDIPFKIDLLKYFEKTFNGTNITIAGDYRIIVQQPSYFKNLTRILNNTSTRTIANFLLYQTVNSMAEETSYPLRDTHVVDDGPLWTFGRSSLRTWYDCAEKTRILLEMAVGQLYFKKHSLENVTDLAKKLVSDVSDAFRTMLASATWMSKTTSDEALKKLDEMIQLVSYPENFFDDDEMDSYLHGLPEVSTTDHFGNMMALSRWYGYRSLIKLKNEPSRFKWPSGPLEINAFYASLQNTIVIPGGVLQPPLFYHEDMAALNYGGVGAIVGHEITHGFDNNGRHFDWSGSLAHWWDNGTKQLYLDRSQCFDDQYSSYNVSDLLSPFESVSGDLKIDGTTSKGENVADNGGMRAAWLAYKQHVTETEEEMVLPGLQQYNQDQLFFVAFSRLWCMQFTPWALQYTLAHDMHSPGHYRILGALQNSREFSEVFSCPVGSKMNPEKKCLLW